MSIRPITASPNDLTVEDAYVRLLHPASRVHTEQSNYYVYMLFDEDELLYIGYTDNISSRRAAHKQDGRIPFSSSSFIVMRDENVAKNLERRLISKYRPPYNRLVTDAVLTGTAQSRQQDRQEKTLQKDTKGLERLEKLRQQQASESPTPRQLHYAAMAAEREAEDAVRIRLWHELLASPQAQAMNEFEAVTYIRRKWGEAISPHAETNLQGFNVEHAVRYGIEAAAVISLFRDCIGFNRAIGSNLIDGKTYTSETVEGFAGHIRFLNANQVRKVLEYLTGIGVLVKFAMPARTGRMLGYAFADEDLFQPEWWPAPAEDRDKGWGIRYTL